MATNYFQRNRGPRENMCMVVTKGEASKLLEIPSVLEKTSAQAICRMINAEPGYTVQLWQLAEMLASKGIQPIMTWMEEKSDAPTPEVEPVSPVQERLKIAGFGVFKDDRLIGWLDDYEGAGLLWLKGERLMEAITVTDPTESDKNVSIAVLRGSRKIIPQYDGKNLCFTVKVTAEGGIIEQQGIHNLAQPHLIKVLEKKMSEEIKKGILTTLNKAQGELGLDIFGFGQAFHRKYKEYWPKLQDNWDNTFAQAKIDIEVETHILDTGLQGRRASTSRD